MTNIELGLGSNTDAARNMHRAQELLTILLPGISFGEAVWTAPMPTATVPHPTKPYLNCLARARTTLPLATLTAKLKQLERTLGDTPGDHRQGTVRIDIDLLAYGTQRLRQPGWEQMP